MRYVLEHDEKSYRRFFEDICAIPHVSYQEKKLSDFIVQFAKDRNLWWHQDKVWNVIVKKPASPGYENHAPVMIQAHLDMVGVKAPESNHNFETDPLDLYLEDGYVKARNTSLGADCGHGISYMLAILDDKALKHPPIEALFTVQEEVGIGGPKVLDYSLLSAKRLIFTDSMNEGSPEMSTTMVVGGHFSKTLKMEACREDAYTIKVDGLTGGHAAVDINKGRANAIKIIARVMCNLMDRAPVHIGMIQGGTLKINIPTYAEIKFTCAESIATIQHIVAEMDQTIKKEQKATDPALCVTLEKHGILEQVLDFDHSRRIMEWITLIPTGTFMHSSQNSDFPLTSRNLATAELVDHELVLGYMFRSSIRTHIPMLLKEQLLLCRLYDARWVEEYSYPGYSVEPETPMYHTYAEVYKELTGKELTPVHIHAGTDVGTIMERMGGLDVIGIGPNTLQFHTPEESLDLASYDRVYSYITNVLKRL